MNPLKILCAFLCYVVPSSGANNEVDRAVDWFDSLGHPELTELEFVQVSTGGWYQAAGQAPKNRFVEGFLLSQDKGEFSVFGLDLSTKTYQRTPEETESHLKVEFTPLDLAGYADKKIIEFNSGKRSSFGPWGTKVDAGVQFFVLARGCQSQGQETQAASLYEAARETLRARNKSAPNDFLALLKSSLSLSEIWQLIDDFGVPAISRRQLLSRSEAFEQNFPHSEYLERARKTASMLKQMVAEDERYANDGRRKAFDQMTDKRQIADLIFRLRDQNGHQWSQPGACDIFNDQAGDKSPAAQLLARQLDAVPALIEILEDERFTRSVGFHRDFYFSHHVLRYGDCAQTIISRIAGRNFYQRKHTNGAMLKDGQAKTSRDLIEEWWIAVQEKGHRQILIDGVSAGDIHACSQASMLVKRYPEAAFAAIQAGIDASDTDFVRTQLTHELGRLKTDDAVKLLTIQLHKAPDLESRVAAATELNKRGDARAVKAMLSEFAQIAGRSNKAETGRLLYFLAQAESPEAIEAIRNNFAKLTVEHRYETLSNLRIDRLISGKSSEEMKQSVESLLISALNDTTLREGLSAYQFGQSYNDPRICDYAALILGAAFDQYTFRIAATESERNAQLKKIQQQYQGQQNRSAPASP